MNALETLKVRLTTAIMFIRCIDAQPCGDRPCGCGVEPFTDGMQCPYCSAQLFLETANGWLEEMKDQK